MTKELTEVVTVRFAKSVVNALKQHQVALGIPPSEFIRRAVAEKLAMSKSGKVVVEV